MTRTLATMTKDLDITEVAVYTEDGRTSHLATFHGWDKREDGWWGHVKVFDAPDGGQEWQTVPAARLVPLVYCGRLPTGEIRHSCSRHLEVWP